MQATEAPTTAIIPLVITGDGFNVKIDPPAFKLREELATQADGITTIASNEESAAAQQIVARIANFERKLEASRELAKAPYINGGRHVDELARNFGIPAKIARARLEELIKKFAKEQREKQEAATREAQRLQRVAENERRIAEERQQAATREAQRLQALADEKRRLADEAKNKQEAAPFSEALASNPVDVAAAQVEADAAHAKLEETTRLAQVEADKVNAQVEQTTRLAQAEAFVSVASTPINVKPTLDFDLVDIHELYRAHPELVTLEPKRREILAVLNKLANAKLPIGIAGIKVREELKVNTREQVKRLI